MGFKYYYITKKLKVHSSLLYEKKKLAKNYLDGYNSGSNVNGTT